MRTYIILSVIAAVAFASDYYKPPRKEKGYGYEFEKVYHSDNKKPHGYHDDPYEKKSYGHVKKYGYKKEYHNDDYSPYPSGYDRYDPYNDYKPHNSGYGKDYEPYGYSYGPSYKPYSYKSYSKGYGDSYGSHDSYKPHDIGYKSHDSYDYKPHDNYDSKKKVYHKGYVHKKEYYEEPKKYDYPKPSYGYDKHDDYDKKKVHSVVVKHYYTKKDDKYDPYQEEPGYGYGNSNRDGQLRGYEAAAARNGYYHKTTYHK